MSHDFGRRTIRGFPPGASAALRGGGSLAAVGVHRSIADVWRSVLAPPVHTPLPAMSAAEVRQHFGRGVLSEARPADGELFGGEVELDLGGLRELGPEDKPSADYFASLDCSCNDGSPAVGDPCGDGGTLTAVTPYFYAGERAPSPCMVAWTCANGNRCECNENRLHAGNRTCDDHGYESLDPEFRCEFNGENCTCYVHCEDGTWVRDAHSPDGYPLCEADGSESVQFRYADGCWRAPSAFGPEAGSPLPLVAKPGGERGRWYGIPETDTIRECLGPRFSVADWLRGWEYSDIVYGPEMLDESSMVWSMDITGVRGGLDQRCEITVFWPDDCSNFWLAVGHGCPGHP